MPWQQQQPPADAGICACAAAAVLITAPSRQKDQEIKSKANNYQQLIGYASFVFVLVPIVSFLENFISSWTEMTDVGENVSVTTGETHGNMDGSFVEQQSERSSDNPISANNTLIPHEIQEAEESVDVPSLNVSAEVAANKAAPDVANTKPPFVVPILPLPELTPEEYAALSPQEKFVRLCEEGDIEKVREFYSSHSHEIDINGRAGDLRETGLIVATKRGHFDLMKILVDEYHADVHVKNKVRQYIFRIRPDI